MQYVTCREAQKMGGLRLVLSVGSPGPWSEAAKSILQARHVAFTPVEQIGLADNDDLYAWTGTRNAPVAMLDDEKPRDSWLDILFLGERLGTGASLLPPTREERAECIGVSHEICGEGGLGWQRRLNIFKMLIDAAGGDPANTPLPARAFTDYAATPDALAGATDALIAILAMLDARLATQRARGSRFLVGSALTATDIHFAAFSGMIDPLPHDLNPMPDFLRELYSSGEPRLRAAISPALIAHRDFIHQTYMTLPLDY